MICCLKEAFHRGSQPTMVTWLLESTDISTALLPCPPSFCQGLPFTKATWMPGEKPVDEFLEVSCLGHKSRWRKAGLESNRDKQKTSSRLPDRSDGLHFISGASRVCSEFKTKQKKGRIYEF